MSTLDFTHTGLQVVGKHTPEFSNETDANGNTVQIELPGTYQLGVLIEGVFVPFLSEKAGKILGIIERGKHDELLTIPGGEYRRLYELQIGLHK